MTVEFCTERSLIPRPIDPGEARLESKVGHNIQPLPRRCDSPRGEEGKENTGRTYITESDSFTVRHAAELIEPQKTTGDHIKNLLQWEHLPPPRRIKLVYNTRKSSETREGSRKLHYGHLSTRYVQMPAQIRGDVDEANNNYVAVAEKEESASV